MPIDARLPIRSGHFRLESGYHTNAWITLDALFSDPAGLAESVDRLAGRLQRHGADAVCGPFVGGAFLALLLAQRLSAGFFYTELRSTLPSSQMFAARYELTPGLRRRIRGAKVAVVDDMISAGSSARATIVAVQAAGASVVAVGCLTVLGTEGKHYFKSIGLPLESVDAQPLSLWPPDDCPLCASKVPLEVP